MCRVTKSGYSGVSGPVIPWPVPPPLDPGGRYPVTCVTSLGGSVAPPRTCLQNLADGVIFIEEKGQYHESP